MIASRVVVVSEVVAELAFRMKLPGIHDVDVSALYPMMMMMMNVIMQMNLFTTWQIKL